MYELVRISYETAGEHLGHLEEGEELTDVPRIAFEVLREPTDTADITAITLAGES